MTTYVMRNGRLVDKAKAGARRGSGAAPSVISDEIPETRHMADGKLYTSKHKFRQATRDAGCVEVGNETSTLLKPRGHGTMPTREQRRHDIRTQLRQMLHGQTAR